MKLQLKDRYIYIVAVINALLLICFGETKIFYDTQSYISAWEASISHLKIDILRTPIYPLFIGLCKIFGGDFLKVVVLLQNVIFLFSVFYFKKITSLFIESKNVVFIITILYIITPGICHWTNCILTEALAISGTVFLFYNILYFITTNKWSYILYSTLWLLFLVFLRPSFIYLLFICLLAWIYMLKKDKKKAIYGISGVLIVISLYCGYCFKFKEYYGIFATSSVGTLNQTYIALQYDLLQPEFTDVLEFKNDIKKKYNKEHGAIWAISNEYISKYGLKTVQESIEKSLHTYPLTWIRKAFHRIRLSSQDHTVSYLGFNYGKILNMFFYGLSVSLFHLYIFIIMYLVIRFYWMIKTKTSFTVSFLIWLAVAGNIFVSVVGAQAEWGRLIAPSAPLLLIMLGQVTNYISIKTTSDNKDILI